MNAELILAIIEAIIRYGPKIVVEIAELFSSDSTPTAADVQALLLTKRPEDYLS